MVENGAAMIDIAPHAAEGGKALRRLLALVLLVLLGAAPSVAAAGDAASDWQEFEEGRVRLVAASTGVGTADEMRLGLEFELAPDWKVYWRAPGDAGYPPDIDWTGSRNLAATEMLWPVPGRFEVLGLQSVGYGKHVILPIRAQVREPGRPLAVRAAVDYLVCADICVPRQAELALTIPAGSDGPSEHAHAIGRFESLVPGPPAAAGMHIESVETRGEGEGAVLRVALGADPPLNGPDIFVEAPDEAMFGAPEVRLEDGGRRAVIEVTAVRGRDGGGGFAGVPVTLTIADGERGAETEAVPVAGAQGALAASSAGAGGGSAGAGPARLAAMLGLALLGGLILNLMPCVLPVLSLKVLGVLGAGGAERRQIRLGFVASAAGIVASFLLLAAGAVALKLAGAAVGWGIQFQQPLFVIALVAIITLFAANLWGLFEIPLPSWLAGAGGGHGQPHSLAGHFATGAFATLLATPCSAPFLGTAVGFALAHGPGEILAIFTMLGLGMALPYLLVAAVPQVAQRLPRPGRWMVTVKRVLALALAATAAWLLTVLAAQQGTAAAAAVALLMLATLPVLALRRRLHQLGRRAAALGVLVLVAMAFVVPGWLPSTQASASAGPAAPAKGLWQPFQRDAVAGLVADGKTVFVDVTADWCITCQVNKTAVLDRAPVAEQLAADGVVAMRADWTRPDDAIAAYLARHGRYGIPFNIVYGPGAPEGVLLPELLTTDAVLRALEKAGGGD